MKYFSSSKLPRLTAVRVLLFATLFMILTGNWTFYRKLIEIYPPDLDNLLFILSVTIFHYGFLLLLMTVAAMLIPARIVVSLMLLLSAVTSFYTDHLGVVIDTEMIRNALQTDSNEMRDLISYGFLLRVTLLGFIPIALVWSLPFSGSGMKKELRYRFQTVLAAATIMVASVVGLGDHYASFLREHKPLRYYMTPGYALYSAVKLATAAIFDAPPPGFAILTEQVQIPRTDTEFELVILVVGETARADHFATNGYQRMTTPELSARKNLISYADISACGTSTAVSVPCMFGYARRDDFDYERAVYSENILDLLRKAGVSILWRDNNTGSKGVASRVAYEDFRSPAVNPVCDIECRDPGMLDGLQRFIDQSSGDILIVLHQMGSHGPAYFKRYPAEFEHFKPACNSIELSKCTTAEIINAYDNTIFYTDYFLARVIELLERNTPAYETTMIYVSDHGESLGEGGLYLHGIPYAFAPAAQTRVPFILWNGQSSDIDQVKTRVLKNRRNSHDALFDTLLKLFEVETDLEPLQAPPLIIIKPEHNPAQ